MYFEINATEKGRLIYEKYINLHFIVFLGIEVGNLITSITNCMSTAEPIHNPYFCASKNSLFSKECLTKTLSCEINFQGV